MILISGGNGFIGNALCKRLSENNDTFRLPNDLLFKPIELKNVFNNYNPDKIFHLAAYGNHSFQDDEIEIINANIIATYNMLISSKAIDYDMFYNFSSSSVTLKTETFYSATKMAAEHICNAFAIKHNKKISNIRPYSVFGEGEAEWRFIPKVISSLLKKEQMIVDINATHDWIYIQDFINALLNGYTEIGTGIKTTNKQIIEMLEEISGLKLEYSQGKLRDYDNEDWYCKNGVPSIPLKDALYKTFIYEKQRLKA